MAGDEAPLEIAAVHPVALLFARSLWRGNAESFAGRLGLHKSTVAKYESLRQEILVMPADDQSRMPKLSPEVVATLVEMMQESGAEPVVEGGVLISATPVRRK